MLIFRGATPKNEGRKRGFPRNFVYPIDPPTAHDFEAFGSAKAQTSFDTADSTGTPSCPLGCGGLLVGFPFSIIYITWLFF